MNAFDVAVIGAGVHGASAAYHLASRGVRTVIFERDAPALGPTGRSSGICRPRPPPTSSATPKRQVPTRAGTEGPERSQPEEVFRLMAPAAPDPMLCSTRGGG